MPGGCEGWMLICGVCVCVWVSRCGWMFMYVCVFVEGVCGLMCVCFVSVWMGGWVFECVCGGGGGWVWLGVYVWLCV